jgi:class 3 adenylate cyclase
LAGDNPHHDNGVRIKDEPIRKIGTCIGDTVNLASRIEEYTKEVLYPLLIDENTRKGLPEHFKPWKTWGRSFFKGRIRR